MADEDKNPQDTNVIQQSAEASAPDGEQEDAVAVFTKITTEDSPDSPTSDDDQAPAESESESDVTEEPDTDGGSEQKPANDVPDQPIDANSQDSQPTQDGASDDTVQDLAAQNARLKNDVMANAGRVQALNARLAEARATIAELENRSSQAPTIDDAALKKTEADFPEAAQLAKAYAERAVHDLRKDLQPVHAAMGQTMADQQAAIQQEQAARLLEAHPDVESIVQDHAFNEWVGNQSEGVQRLHGSAYADDVIALMNLYKQTTAKPQAQPPQQSPADSRPASGTAPATTPRKDLSQHAELPRSGASRAGVEPDDPIEIFAAITANS